MTTPHIHAELMRQYALDAMETDRPWERWMVSLPQKKVWTKLPCHPLWSPSLKYLRLNPLPIPHPHAKLMLQYAEDSADTERAWERWEQRIGPDQPFTPLTDTPYWLLDIEYRRKHERVCRNDGWDADIRESVPTPSPEDQDPRQLSLDL